MSLQTPSYALHPESFNDIDEIRAQIAEDSQDAADRIVNEIFNGIRLLVQFPYQGYRRPNLTSRPLRFKVVREYVIVYAPDKSPLWVVAVFHGRRSRRVMVAILRGREYPPPYSDATASFFFVFLPA